MKLFSHAKTFLRQSIAPTNTLLYLIHLAGLSALSGSLLADAAPIERHNHEEGPNGTAKALCERFLPEMARAIGLFGVQLFNYQPFPGSCHQATLYCDTKPPSMTVRIYGRCHNAELTVKVFNTSTPPMDPLRMN